MPDLNPNPSARETAMDMLARKDVLHSPDAYRSVLNALLADIDGLELVLKNSDQERYRLNGLINAPEILNFLEAIQREAAHQRERWGTDHDAGKAPTDWLFLVGHLGTRACFHAAEAERLSRLSNPDSWALENLQRHQEKYLHHIITMGAAACNWHANASGANTRMRAGIESPVELEKAAA